MKPSLLLLSKFWRESNKCCHPIPLLSSSLIFFHGSHTITTTTNSSRVDDEEEKARETKLANHILFSQLKVHDKNTIQKLNNDLALSTTTDIQITFSSKMNGYGLIAQRDFAANEHLFSTSILSSQTLKQHLNGTYFHHYNDTIKLRQQRVSNKDEKFIFKFAHSHSLQIGINQHIIMDFLPAIFFNHSCDANVGLQIIQSPMTTAKTSSHFPSTELKFIAMNKIQKGQELKIDYETFEYDLTEREIECKCGSKRCRGILKGYKYHGEIVRELYGDDFIAPYLLSL